MGDATGMVIGHEPMGVVEGQSDQTCSFCAWVIGWPLSRISAAASAPAARGFTNDCLITNPGKIGAAYDYPQMGDYRGAQAELVPFDDENCVRLPGEPGDAWEHDFALLADAFTTGYHATGLAHVSAGDRVVIVGAGAIGLLATYSALRLRVATGEGWRNWSHPD